MDRLTKTLFGIVAALVVIVAFLALFFERVPVRTYGVKQYVWGGGGIDKEDYLTGYHVGITGLHKWYLLDASTHFLEFGEVQAAKAPSSRGYLSIFPRSSGAADLDTPVYRSEKPLEIRNKDGNVVTIDVSVPYRIRPGSAHMIVAGGLQYSYQERVKATVESVLREELSSMSNEVFQDTEARLKTAEAALATLNASLEQFHVQAEAVLIRRIAFPAEYEGKLQDKQLLTQKALLDQAEAIRLGEELRTGTIEKEIAAAEALKLAEWEKKLEELKKEYAVQVATINAEALQYSKKTKSEGEAAYQTKVAQGELALEKAEATLDRLRTEVLDTPGGRFYLGRLAAQNIRLDSVTLNAADPRVPVILDIHRVADLLVGEGHSGTQGANGGEGPIGAEGAASAPVDPEPHQGH
jgi:hypothetical protein